MPDASTQTEAKIFHLPQTLTFLAENIEDIKIQIAFMEKLKVSSTATELENYISMYRYLFGTDPTPTELQYAIHQHLLESFSF